MPRKRKNPGLSVSEAAKALGCSLSNIRYLVEVGKLEAIRAGERFFIPEASAEAYKSDPDRRDRSKSNSARALKASAAALAPGDLVEVQDPLSGEPLRGVVLRPAETTGCFLVETPLGTIFAYAADCIRVKRITGEKA